MNIDKKNRNIFLYWVGKEYKLINILRNLIYLHSTNGKGYNVVLITDKNINLYIKNLPINFNKLCPAHQADFVRVNVLCEYGGIWMDSDTLVMDSLDSLFYIIENTNGFFIKENNNHLCNGVLGSKPNTQLIIKWKTEIINKLDNSGYYLQWNAMGSDILENIYKTDKNLYDDYVIFNGLNNMYPVNWDNCVKEFINKPYNNYKTIIREYQPFIVLVNSVYKEMEGKKDILNCNIPLTYFIKKSYENRYVNKSNLCIHYNNSKFYENTKFIKKNLAVYYYRRHTNNFRLIIILIIICILFVFLFIFSKKINYIK